VQSKLLAEHYFHSLLNQSLSSFQALRLRAERHEQFIKLIQISSAGSGVAGQCPGYHLQPVACPGSCAYISAVLQVCRQVEDVISNAVIFP